MAAEETNEEKRAFIESLMGALEALVANERRVAWLLATGVAAKICRERGADSSEEAILRLGLGVARERAMAEAYAGEEEINNAYKKARELLLSGLEELATPRGEGSYR